MKMHHHRLFYVNLNDVNKQNPGFDGRQTWVSGFEKSALGLQTLVEWKVESWPTIFTVVLFYQSYLIRTLILLLVCLCVASICDIHGDIAELYCTDCNVQIFIKCTKSSQVHVKHSYASACYVASGYKHLLHDDLSDLQEHMVSKQSRSHHLRTCANDVELNASDVVTAITKHAELLKMEIDAKSLELCARVAQNKQRCCDIVQGESDKNFDERLKIEALNKSIKTLLQSDSAISAVIRTDPELHDAITDFLKSSSVECALDAVQPSVFIPASNVYLGEVKHTFSRTSGLSHYVMLILLRELVITFASIEHYYCIH